MSPPVLTILQQFFSYCKALSAALEDLNTTWKSKLKRNSTFEGILESILVTSKEEKLCFHLNNTLPREKCSSQKELVNVIISMESRQHPPTVLAVGYKKTKLPEFCPGRIISMSETVEVASRFPNTIVTLVKGPFWEWLLSIIGCDLMFFLLHNCFLFYPLGKGSYVQVSGIPIYLMMKNAASVKVTSSTKTPRPLFQYNLWSDDRRQRKRQSEGATTLQRKKHCSSQMEKQPCKSAAVGGEERPTTSLEELGRKRTAGHLSVSVGKKKKSDKACFSAGATSKCNAELSGMKKKFKSSKKSKKKGVLSLNSCKRSEVLIKRKQIFHNPVVSEKFSPKNPLESTPLSTTGVRKLVRAVFDPRNLQPRKFDKFQIVQVESTHKKPTLRLSRRLRALVPLFKKLLMNHRKCRYSYILNNTCPLPENFSRPGSAPGDSYTERLTEQLDYQSYYSLIPCHTPKHQVVTFLHAVLGALIPKELWGAKENERAFHSHVIDLVNLRFYESYSLKEAMEGLKLSQCFWITSSKASGENRTQSSQQTHPSVQTHPRDQMHPSHQAHPPCHTHQSEARSLHQTHPPRQTHPSKTHPPQPTHPCTHISNVENLKCTQMLECLVLWILNRIVIPAIKTFFYVTESSSHKNHVFFYRKPVWKRICQLAMSDLRSTMAQPLSKTEVQLLLSTGKTFGVPTMRLLPKSSGVRPIVNLASRQKDPLDMATGRAAQPVNQKLQDLFAVLKYEKKCREKLMASSVLGLDDIYWKWKQFAKQQAKNRKPLFFVSADISGCFDSIPQQKLMSVMERIIHHDEYVLRRYCKLQVEGNRVRRKFGKLATTTGDCGLFADFAAGLLRDSSLHDVILVDMVYYPFVSRASLFADLRKHIFCNIFKFNGQYYQQTQGITQGSVLSSLLCSFFYGDMERKFLPKIPTGKGILIRLIDDFLLVVEDGSIAVDFLNVVSKGIPEYNCCINSHKTIKNFQVLPDGSAQVDTTASHWFPWCGLLINTQTLEVANDYTRLCSQDISDTLTVVRSQHPLYSLQRHLRKYVGMRAHSIYVDAEMNSHQHILRHCYTTMMIVAMKFHSSIKAFRMGTRIHSHSLQLYGVILELVRHFYYTARRRHNDGKEGRDFVPFNLFSVLCLKAFLVVLQKKQSSHFQIILKLKSEFRRGYRLLNAPALGEVKKTVAECSPDILKIKY